MDVLFDRDGTLINPQAGVSGAMQYAPEHGVAAKRNGIAGISAAWAYGSAAELAAAAARAICDRPCDLARAVLAAVP